MRLHTRGRKSMKRRVPQLNTTATADISFMLLIFFLITTSMDSDKGLRRQLPPKDVQTEVEAVDVDRNKVLTIDLCSDNSININDTVRNDKQLSLMITDFVKKLGDDHIIELKVDRTATYDAYFHLQNVIVSTYRHNLKGKYKQRISEQFIDKTQQQTNP